MAGYIPLFSSLISSSVWNEDSDTCKVWITLMAMSDKDGVVEGSAVGIAPIARVSAEACATAIKILESPDPNSRSPEYEGRRILPIPGGWKLTNHQKYRNLAKSRAIYYRAWREEQRERKEKEKGNEKEKEQTQTHTQTGATTRNNDETAPNTDLLRNTNNEITVKQPLKEWMKVKGDKDEPFEIATLKERQEIARKAKITP